MNLQKQPIILKWEEKDQNRLQKYFQYKNLKLVSA